MAAARAKQPRRIGPVMHFMFIIPQQTPWPREIRRRTQLVQNLHLARGRCVHACSITDNSAQSRAPPIRDLDAAGSARAVVRQHALQRNPRSIAIEASITQQLEEMASIDRASPAAPTID